MKIKISFLIIFWFLPILCSAQELQPFSGRVSVSVSANDDIKGKIESYISRELRSLGDIVVTDDNPRWILSIVALESTTKSGYKSGIEISVVILEPFDNSLVISQVNEKSKEFVSTMTSGLHSFSGQWLRVGAPEDLRSICNGIVADFDSQHIKPARDFWQSYIDYQKKQSNKETSPNKAN